MGAVVFFFEPVFFAKAFSFGDQRSIYTVNRKRAADHPSWIDMKRDEIGRVIATLR